MTLYDISNVDDFIFWCYVKLYLVSFLINEYYVIIN